MRLLFVVFADPFHGLGHWHRTKAVLTMARHTEGYQSLLASNYNGEIYINNINQLTLLNSVMSYYHPDWLVIDILETLPDEVVSIARRYNAKIALLNGVGRKEDSDKVDLIWSQDHPDKAILRFEVLQLKKNYSDRTFVWGGATDELDLCNTYQKWMTNPAWIVTTNFRKYTLGKSNNLQQVQLEVEHDAIFKPMTHCNKAVIHLGMMAWELAYLRIPFYVFSKNQGHLQDAYRFEQMGFAKAYPYPGLPSDAKTFRDFVNEPFKIKGKRPDGQGAKRFLDSLK